MRAPHLTAAATLVAFSGSPAAAQPDSSDVQVGYLAPAGCPGDAEFRAALRKRLSSRSSESAPTQRYRVQIRPTGSQGFEGALIVEDQHTGTHQRLLSAESCRELSDALAFLTAIAIELEGRADDLPETAFDLDRGTPQPQPPDPEHADMPSHPARSDTPQAGPPARFAVLVGGGIRGGVRPDLAPTIESYVSWSFGAARSWTTVLAGGVFAPTGRTTLDGGASARLGLVAGVVAVCPLSHALDYGLSIAPCGGFEVGVLPSYGNALEARSGFPLWIAAELALTSRWMLPHSAFFIEAQGKVLITVERSRFYFDPADTTVYEAAPVVAGATLGAGIVLK